MSVPYLTGNLFVNFPFRDDCSLVSIEGPELPLNFFVDAVIQSTYLVEQAYLKQIRSGNDGDDYLEFDFADGASVILNTLRIHAADYALYGVLSDYNSTTKTVTRVVLGGADFGALFSMIPVSINFTLTSASLSVHALNKASSKILRFRKSSGTWRSAMPMKLKAGYNLQLTLDTPDTDPNLVRSRVTLSAISGAGEGQYDTCTDEVPLVDYVGVIGGATADSQGNLNIEGDNCYQIKTSASANKIILSNDCSPGCMCSDYVKVGEAMEQIQAVHDSIKADLFNVLIPSLNASVSSYNSTVVPQKKKLMIKVQAVAKNPDSDDGSRIVTVHCTNNSGAAVTNIAYLFTLPGGWSMSSDKGDRMIPDKDYFPADITVPVWDHPIVTYPAAFTVWNGSGPNPAFPNRAQCFIKFLITTSSSPTIPSGPDYPASKHTIVVTESGSGDFGSGVFCY